MEDKSDQQAVTVAQEDREAATLYWQSQDIGSPETYAQIRAGRRDDSHLIRAFARHRLASVSSASAEGRKFRNDDGDVISRDRLIADFKAWLDPFWVRALEYIAAPPEPVPATNQAGEVERREAMARIIDPNAWADYDFWAGRLRGEGRWPDDADQCETMRETYRRRMPERVAPSLAKATAFAALATQPATSQEAEACALCSGKGFADAQCPVCMLAATPTPPTLSEDLRALVMDAAERNWNHGPDALTDAIVAALAQVKAS